MPLHEQEHGQYVCHILQLGSINLSAKEPSDSEEIYLAHKAVYVASTLKSLIIAPATFQGFKANL